MNDLNRAHPSTVRETSRQASSTAFSSEPVEESGRAEDRAGHGKPAAPLNGLNDLNDLFLTIAYRLTPRAFLRNQDLTLVRPGAYPAISLITTAFRYSFDALVLGLQFFSLSEFLESFLEQVLCAHIFDGRDVVIEPANLLLIR